MPIKGLAFRDLDFDLPTLISTAYPIVFDVGANKGQTIDMIRRCLPNPTIIAFEPNPDLFLILKERYRHVAKIRVEKCALGSNVETRNFHILQNNELSSFLDISQHRDNPFRETKELAEINVSTITTDFYASQNNIQYVDLLKIDVQGFDLQVLFGATRLLEEKRIGTLLVEVNFVQMYEGQPSFSEIERYLRDKGYGLLGLYEIVRIGDCAAWATACFRPINTTPK